MLLEQIKQKSEENFTEIQAIRHHLHANPELSYQEHKTAAFVASKLTSWNIEHMTGVAGTGVVGIIRGNNPDSHCIALRADMDALPIQEKNETSYCSQNDGIMHACGHDVHTSCLLGAAKILYDLRHELQGTIKLIFQPGEEMNPGGASLMIEAGVLENPKPDAIFALHVYPSQHSGTLGFRAGQYMASADEIYITIGAKGGHAALPHLSADPIAISALIITGLQQVVSRKCNPLIPSVLTFGKIQGGFATNVIPEYVDILGTFRTMDEPWRKEAHKLIKEFTIATAAAYGATAAVDIPPGYPSLYNDPALTNRATQWGKDYVGESNVYELDKRMAGEDFSFYTQHIPGCFFRIGTSQNGEQFTAPVHNAHFDIHEEALKTGMGMMAWCAVNALR